MRHSGDKVKNSLTENQGIILKNLQQNYSQEINIQLLSLSKNKVINGMSQCSDYDRQHCGF